MAEWTTEDVRLRILRGFAESSVRDRLERQFSEWLTAHDAEVRAQALRDFANEMSPVYAIEGSAAWHARAVADRAERGEA